MQVEKEENNSSIILPSKRILRIAIVCLGIRRIEEMRPIIELAIEIKNNNHVPRIVSNTCFQKYCSNYNIDFFCVRGSASYDVFSSYEAQSALEGGYVSHFQNMERDARYKRIDEEREDLLEGCKDVDLIVCNRYAIIEVWSIAEFYKTPLIGIAYSPNEEDFGSGDEKPNPIIGNAANYLPPIELPFTVSFSFLNRLSYPAINWWEWKPYDISDYIDHS